MEPAKNPEILVFIVLKWYKTAQLSSILYVFTETGQEEVSVQVRFIACKNS